ncbi:MAG: hypothetical protein ACNA8L_13380 [Luteolibacter sp.]|jgi:TolA-binding protein
MKYKTYALVALAATLTIACNKEKAEIDGIKNAATDAIEIQKEEVDADARHAAEQTELNARIDQARIEADRISANAQLDADRKQVQAEADAAKARVDAGLE